MFFTLWGRGLVRCGWASLLRKRNITCILAYAIEVR